MGRKPRIRPLAVALMTGACFFVALPALAANQTVTATSGNTFSPNSVTINQGENVTFTNGDGYGYGNGFHNVAWEDGGAPTTPSTPQPAWSTNPSRTFSNPGVYRFRCENHSGSFTSGMVGTVTVLQPGGAPPPPPPPAQDKIAPLLGKVYVTVGKKRFTLKFASSEKGTASGTLKRRNTKGVYKTFGAVSFSVKASDTNSITIKKTTTGKLLTLGKFRLTFRVKDAAGNFSATKTVTFTITR